VVALRRQGDRAAPSRAHACAPRADTRPERALRFALLLSCALTARGPCAAQAQAPAPAEPFAPPTVSTSPAAALPSVPTRPLEQAVEFTPGATCLERELLLRRVARWLRRDDVDAGLTIKVQGSATRKNSASFAMVHVDGRRAERRIDDAPADCDQFHSALALSIALAIDATLSAPAPAGEEPLAPPEPSGPPYFRLAFGVLGHATAGVLTDVSGALSARAEVGFVPWLDVRGSFVASALSDQRFPNAEGRFDIQLLAGAIDACLAHSVAPHLRLAVCAGAMAGALQTRGHEDARLDARKDAKPWFGLDGSFEAQAELLPWLALVAGVDLVVPLATQRIIVAASDSNAAAGERELTSVGVLIGAGPVFRVF
jgi:hypothetical protein